MLRKALLTVPLLLATAPAFAQSAAQCEQALYIGPDNASPALMAACASYFQGLANNAAAPGTFSTNAPTVVISSQGTGG